MKKSKNAFCSILAFVVTIGILTGCATQSVENDEKLTIKWLGAPYYSLCEEGTFPERQLEEKFNIDIKPIFMDVEGYKTKKPITMSSGDIPDLIYEMDPLNVQADAKQGFLMEVPYEDIINYAPSVVQELNKEVPEVWLYSHYNGNNYGVPNIFLGEIPKYGIWRTDWLANVGIDKIPETLDEMYEALYRFSNNDPDGNGKKDTYGMSGDLKSTHVTFSEIFGAFGVLPFNWMNRDGKIVYGGVLPETLEAIQVLAKWYKDGLIDPDFITDNTSKNIPDKFKNGAIGYINDRGHMYDSFDQNNQESIISVLKKINPTAQIGVGPLPKGPNGKSGIFVWGKGGHVISFGRQLKDQPKKYLKILEILEYLQNNREFSLKLVIGNQGEHWDYQNPELGSRGGIKRLPPYDVSTQFSKTFATDSMSATSFFNIIPLDRSMLDLYTASEKVEHREKHVNISLGMKDVFLKPDAIPESEKYFNDLKSKQLIAIAGIIRGEKGIEAYDEFIEQWNTQGGKELEKNAAELANTVEKIYKEVGVSP